MNLLSRYLLLLLFLFLPVFSFAGGNFPLNELSVSFDFEKHQVMGISKITLPAGESATINFSGLKIISASIDKRKIIIKPGAAAMNFSPVNPNEVLEIEYEAEFKSLPEAEQNKNPGVVKGNLISHDGIVLTDEWYPSAEGLSTYKLTATLPDDFEGISEADEISKKKIDGGIEFSFAFDHPVPNISLIAGKYVVERDRYVETDIFTYFLPEDKGLSKKYIEYTKKYLNMYERLIGVYPFRRFSIVENILPTGYSIPTFTLLGKDVIKLPFIVETSLGHEILHQWFGNCVYNDFKSGNWSEGLTTYLADQMYEELKGDGWDYRKNILISFQSYVMPENDFPLKSFTNRVDRASGAIGYGKSAMVFHMLKNLFGEKTFYSSLNTFIEKNKFSNASWNDIEGAFESASGKKLDWFFKQWIEEKGAPEIEAQNINLKYNGSKTVVSLDILQKGRNYKILLPILLKLKDKEIRKTVELEKEFTTLEIEADSEVIELVIDDNYDVFRKLSDKEFPPVISRLLGDRNKIFVMPKEKREEYSPVYEFLKEEGFALNDEEEIKYDDMKSASLVIPEIKTRIVKRLFGEMEKLPGDFYLTVKGNPFNSKSVIAVIDSSSPSEMYKDIRKMTHYGKYSIISFRGGTNILKATGSSDKGMRAEVVKEILGAEVSHALSITDVIEKVSGKSIVYVGESHDKFEDHRVQLQIIKGLHSRNKKVAIGMEMFQKPFQKVLDDYIAGIIDEKTFLKKSEYFKRWGYDYDLYREIMLFARENKIPVVALNVRGEITSKVFKGGISSLTKEESKEIPEYIDLSNDQYRERLKEEFEKHKNSENQNFDFFYEAQVIWDESMAHNLNEFIQKNHGYQVIVLAGEGHVAFRAGIPERAYRLNKKEYSIILNNEDIEKNIADYILFPPYIKAPEPPRLRVQLGEEKGRIKIVDFLHGSVLKMGGMKKDDIILSLDGTKVESVDDIRIFLLYKKRGDEIIIKALRERFLFGTSEMEFKVRLN